MLWRSGGRNTLACPTTCVKGSDTTGITIGDLKSVGLQTGISSVLLKTCLAIIDATTTKTLPAGAVAATGFDVLAQAVESHPARPFTSRTKPAHPNQHPAYQDSTPCDDLGSLAAIRIGMGHPARAAFGAAAPVGDGAAMRYR